MTTLDPASKSADQTYGTLISTTWTTIETGTGIICACLPMLKAPLTLIFPRLLLNSSNKGTYDSHAHQARRDAGPEKSQGIKKKAPTFDSWGRPESNEDLIPNPSFSGVCPQIVPGSEQASFGKHDDKNIPMGMINKRTDVSISYDDNGSIASSDISHMTVPASKVSKHGGVRYP